MKPRHNLRKRWSATLSRGATRPQSGLPGALGLIAVCLLAPLPAVAAQTAAKPAPPVPIITLPPRSAEADEKTYDRCMGLAGHDPAAAKKLAERWRKRGGAHPADHCFAVALVGLKQYKEGATRLETLANAMIHAPDALRAAVMDQASQAWLLAGDPPRAYRTETAALKFMPDNPDLLVDRAEAAGEAGWFDKAIPDLDIVLKADPHRVDALIYRATAYRALGRLGPAFADADAAVRLAPKSAPALLERGNILRLKGDTAGARRDWQRVSALAPGSAAGLAAKANIAHLDSKAGSPPTAGH